MHFEVGDIVLWGGRGSHFYRIKSIDYLTGNATLNRVNDNSGFSKLAWNYAAEIRYLSPLFQEAIQYDELR